jgi:hypothetical protein
MDKQPKLLPISIISAALIICVGMIINALPNRYKVVGNQVFDTITGKYISKNLNSTQINAEDEKIEKIDLTPEIETLIETRNQGGYLTPLQRRKLEQYYSQFRTDWASEYQNDVNNGKVENVNEFDIRRIEIGMVPMGKYKNINDAPDWYKNPDKYFLTK